FAPLQERLELMLQLRNPPPQLSVLGFEFGDPLLAWVVHDPCSLRETAETGKRNCLTVTRRRRSAGGGTCNSSSIIGVTLHRTNFPPADRTLRGIAAKILVSILECLHECRDSGPDLATY